MAAISWLGLTGFVRQNVAAVQAGAYAAIDASQGSVTLALAQSVAGVALWLQAQVATVLQVTRLSTSTGTDCDSFGADFTFTRLAATSSGGSVTLSRYTTGTAVLIPVGNMVSTGPGGILFAIAADTTNAAWNSAQNGYLLASGAASIVVPIVAVLPGTTGNVAANTITSFLQAIPGIDNVTNPTALTNGMAAESDAAFKARFQLFINTRSLATTAAVAYAVASVQQGLTYFIAQNQDPNGATDMGFFTVTIDDGTGNPPSALLAAITTAITAVRPIGSRFIVQGPVVATVNVSVTLTTQPASNKPNVVGPVATAITAYVNALPVGATLLYGRLYQIIYNVDPSITLAEPLTLNGGTADITVSATSGVAKVGTVAVD